MQGQPEAHSEIEKIGAAVSPQARMPDGDKACGQTTAQHRGKSLRPSHKGVIAASVTDPQDTAVVSQKSHGQALSRQRLSEWIADTCRTAYELANLPPPESSLPIPSEAWYDCVTGSDVPL
ncbi:UNVERIFIED_CONTAM: hypothetical protein FKN15_067291 [Acipenser sinensis]